MNSKYAHIQESIETYDDIGDIMHHRIILYALEVIGKKLGMIETSFEKQGYASKEINDILRVTLESEDISKEFLKIVRTYISKARDIKTVQWNAKLLTSFLLCWRELEFRVNSSPESLQNIFSEKIHEVIKVAAEQEAYNIGNTYMNMARGINILTQKNIIPINTHGEFVFGIMDGSDFFEVFQVVSTSNDIQMIDKNGKILSEQDIDEKNMNGLKKKKEFLLDCIDYLEGRKNKYTIQVMSQKLQNIGIDITQKSREKMIGDIKNHIRDIDNYFGKQRFKVV